MSNDLTQPSDLLFQEIRQLIDAAKQRAAVAINAELTLLYWQVAKRIQSEVLQGQCAEYGKQVLLKLTPALTQAYGKGWGERQLHYCVVLAEAFPDREILQTVCAKLSWSHFKLLIGIEDHLKRDFYIELVKLNNGAYVNCKNGLTPCSPSAPPSPANPKTPSVTTLHNCVKTSSSLQPCS